jgi:hypothetical protein
MAQIPILKKKYLKYESFKDQTIRDIFNEKEMENTLELKAYEFASGVLLNDGNGAFVFARLPVEAQFTSMYAIEILDIDRDGNLDILMGGNLYGVKPEMGRYDASYGAVFRGDGKGNFQTIPSTQSGFVIDGETRDLATIQIHGTRQLLVARNNDTILFFKTK